MIREAKGAESSMTDQRYLSVPVNRVSEQEKRRSELEDRSMSEKGSIERIKPKVFENELRQQ
jgi:hypothetical protein